MKGIGLAAALALATPGAVRAHDVELAAGSLDPGFGNDGVALQGFGGLSVQANGLVIDRRDRIVVAGSTHQSQLDSAFLLTRYLPDGRPDPSLGGGNGVVTSFPGGGANANALAIQPDGGIVVAGTVTTAAPDGSGVARFALARYQVDGTLDASFGQGGLVATGFGGGIDFGYAVAVQDDGRIIVVGQVLPPGGPTYNCGLARYERDGSLDPTFGTGGLVSVDLGGHFNQACNAVEIGRDGKIVAAGFSKEEIGDLNFAVIRLHRDGSLDQRFGTSGKAFAEFGGLSSAQGLTIQRDGKIVVAGTADRTTSGPLVLGLARFDQHGLLDPTFGTDGLVSTEVAGRTVSGSKVAIDRFDRIVAVGTAEGFMGYAAFLVTRYDSRGVPDASFGTGGAVLTPFEFSGALASGLGFLDDGDIVVAGTSGADIKLAAYAPGPDCRRHFDR